MDQISHGLGAGQQIDASVQVCTQSKFAGFSCRRAPAAQARRSNDMPQHHRRAVAGDLDHVFGSIGARRREISHDDMRVCIGELGDTGGPWFPIHARREAKYLFRNRTRVRAGDSNDPDSAASGRSGDSGDESVFQTWHEIAPPATRSLRSRETIEKQKIEFFRGSKNASLAASDRLYRVVQATAREEVQPNFTGYLRFSQFFHSFHGRGSETALPSRERRETGSSYVLAAKSIPPASGRAVPPVAAERLARSTWATAGSIVRARAGRHDRFR